MVLEQYKKKVLECLSIRDMSRPEIVKITRIPRSSVYDTLAHLKKIGKVQRYTDPELHKIGRPKVFWRLIE